MSRADLPSRPGLGGRLKGRIVAARRRVKETDETLRVAFGVLRRRLGLEPRLGDTPLFEPRPVAFRPYRPIEGWVPMTAVTPADGAYMHSFFDIPPLSPSGRLLAVTRLPFGHRAPYPGDLAEICVIDLEARTIRVVHRTEGWGLQLGANLQWHPTSDRFLYANDRAADGSGVAVAIDLEAGAVRHLRGPLYALDPSGRYMLGPALDLINRAQPGYGVPEPLFGRRRVGRGASREEGLWRTDLETGRRELFLSIADIVRALPDRRRLEAGVNILFHTKINREGSRVFQVLRSHDLPDRPGVPRSQIVTFKADGGGIRSALPIEAWDRGGHHPSWLADGEHILMNLVPEGETAMRFVRFRHDGRGLETIGPWRGSGHPSLDSAGRFIVTDAYLNEGFGRPDGEAPLRLLDLAGGEEHHLTPVNLGPPNLRARRLDPHPAWTRDEAGIVFNAVIDGRRQVVIADLAELRAKPAPTATDPTASPLPVPAGV